MERAARANETTAVVAGNGAHTGATRDRFLLMFKLLRYFSLTSFVSVVVVAAVLGMVYREIAVHSLIAMGESNNRSVTRVLSSALSPKLMAYLAVADTLPSERLLEHPQREALAETLAASLKGLSLSKVEVYDMGGRTVFSTDPKQIGEDRSDNAGFRQARSGVATSELTHRDEFSGLEGVIENADLLSTYIPVRRSDGAISAIFQVYDDVTPFLARIERMQWLVVVGVFVMLCVLYGVLFVIVRHADGVIQRQYRQRDAAERALKRAQRTLEQRVEQRTLELARVNAGLQAEVAERRLADQRVVHMAHHDALTGLPNRTLFADRVGQAIARAHRRDGKIAVLFLDLDRFKNVNDSLGHAIGDLLLTAVAERLTHCLRDEDTAARLGGDEFIISLPDVADAGEAARVAARILAELAKPFTIADHQLHADGSIGIALYPADGDSAETLMRNADTAMYHAKESGRANYQFFSAQMTERVSRRLSTETDLRRALEHGEFALHYQPLIDLGASRVSGAEALLRWPQNEHRLMSPAEFIPIAEDTGLIIPLGEWVLLEACSQAQAWQARHPGLRIAVNLSARQFRQKDLIGMIERVLGETGLAPTLLELELTESMLMHHAEETVGILTRLDEMGVRLAIDDFGTGYSSLSYLKRFPIHSLKVDRSFVRDISTDPDDAAIVTAIVAMARSLNLDVTAEGVETEEQATFLRSLACHQAQGYYFGRPMPAQEFAARLALTGTAEALRVAA